MYFQIKLIKLFPLKIKSNTGIHAAHIVSDLNDETPPIEMNADTDDDDDDDLVQLKTVDFL